MAVLSRMEGEGHDEDQGEVNTLEVAKPEAPG